MRIFRAPSLGTAHELAVKMVLEKGRVLDTEDKEATIEFDEIAMRVENPDTEPMVSPHSRFSRKFMEKYAEDLLTGTPAEFEYDYHDRLFNWGNTLQAEGIDASYRPGRVYHPKTCCISGQPEGNSRHLEPVYR